MDRTQPISAARPAGVAVLTDLAAGKLLVATPSLLDPNFRRTIVLLLEHDAEGSMGLVLNRPAGVGNVDEMPFAHAQAPPVDVFVGGPVLPEHGIGLAAGAGPFDMALTIGELHLGLVGADTLDVDRVRYFAGHAGWSPGQLEAEVDEAAWWVVDAAPGDPFTDDPAGLWRAVLRRQGGALTIVATLPAQPELN